MQKLLQDQRGGAIARGGFNIDTLTVSTPLLEVLWRRRWTLVLTVVACAFLAALYLACSTRIYSATSKVLVQQNSPKIIGEHTGHVAQSDTYLQAQLDVIGSTPVLTRALESVNYKSLNTFASISSDPVNWLRNSGALKLEVSKKSDTILVAMESPFAKEAADLANAVVSSFIHEQAEQKQSTGTEMVRILQHEKDELQKQRDQALQAMVRYKRANGVLSFREGDKGNTILQRAASLSDSLTRAEITTMELQSQQLKMAAALESPRSIANFVEAQQSKGRDFGDREYEDLRSQLNQSILALSSAKAIQGTNHTNIQILLARIEQLRTLIEQKQRLMVEAQLADVTAQLAAAEATEKQLRAAQQAQKGDVLDMTPDAAAYAKLESEVERMQKQCDLIDSRIAEISLNSIASAPLDIRVLETARAEERPIKPRKTLALSAALMVGWVLGMGLAVLREWQDARLRKPEEIMELLGTPVLAMVPPINPRLSAVTRGQLVRLDARSAAAEAYRSIRTSLHLGASGSATKTILLASPTPGDGKSTIASNLAIACAQSGDRTLLVDCDLRNPVQHLIFETDGEVGLSNVMTGDEKLRNALRQTRVPGLYLLPCGRVPENPSEMLGSKRFARLMETLGETFDRIIIDSPPALSATDACILGASADATLIVLRMNRSMRQLGVLALGGLQQVGANVLGAIANDVPTERSYQNEGAWQYSANASPLVRRSELGLPSDAPTIREPDWHRPET